MPVTLPSLALPATAPLAFAGLAVAREGARRFALRTDPGIAARYGPVTPDRPFRVASVSKCVTAGTLTGAAARAGIADPWGTDAADVLGFALRHPEFPGTPVTLGMLAGHSAALDENAGYAVPPGADLRDWLAATPGLFRAGTRPGVRFSYANLGYVLLAQVAQVWGGASFGTLARDLVLTPLGLDAGFNWAGMDAETRARALPTFRRGAAGFIPQIDADVPSEGVIHGESAVSPANAAAFSPQGGLRLSLDGMLTLAVSLADEDPMPLWRHTDGPGDYLDGLFQDYGAGLQLLPDPPFYPRPLIGHFGNAYGFNGGIWWDAEARIAFAYALNGLAEGNESDALSPDELAMFAGVARQGA